MLIDQKREAERLFAKNGQLSCFARCLSLSVISYRQNPGKLEKNRKNTARQKPGGIL